MLFNRCRHESKISGGTFDIPSKSTELAALEAETGKPDFWNNNQEAQRILKKITELKKIIDPWKKVYDQVQESAQFFSFALEEKDSQTIAELATHIPPIEKEVDQLEFMRKLGGEDDAKSAVLTIHSGAGGTESCDWCEMLFRMYCRWCEIKNYSTTVIDIVPGDTAGIKSVSMQVEGAYAYGHLRAETGVHRLVRISPFDANKRRHTSFASVYPYPIFEEDSTDNFVLDEEEIRIDTYRSSGAGGQHVNKTESAVRMTHLPTGIVVQCQNERSQIKNRAVALKLLKARVRYHFKEIEEKERQDKMAEKKKIEWGSQIRSYILHPYNLVKDHRTEVETSDAQSVLDGAIDPFIEAYLLSS
ncbi:MAG: peptide chain release factor 2 [Chitinivibrionales bacterium]|nr:peptide chain release factor 2 [Chitinivibrionales bacterium]